MVLARESSAPAATCLLSFSKFWDSKKQRNSLLARARPKRENNWERAWWAVGCGALAWVRSLFSKKETCRRNQDGDVLLCTCGINTRTCGLVAMTSAPHAKGRQLDPGQVYSPYLPVAGLPQRYCANTRLDAIAPGDSSTLGARGGPTVSRSLPQSRAKTVYDVRAWHAGAHSGWRNELVYAVKYVT